jgi:nitronate monooxygenase
MMKLPQLRIGELVAPIPIIQGGMGVGVSLSRLAAAVASAGGVGVISGVQTGFREPDFVSNNLTANLRALRREIGKAREMAPRGIIGVNVMVAINHYKETVRAAVENGIDMIISGAGLPMELPALVKGTRTKAVPIVSSGRAAAVIARSWDRKHAYAPDMVIVEGPEAGGHLGFSPEQLQDPRQKPALLDIVRDVLDALRPYREKYQKYISVVAAGGIYDGKDIAACLKAGADGVQMATRFVGTEECDAHPNFKQAYLDARPEDIKIIVSPVGMPGRAIRNRFIRTLEHGNIPIEHCYDCIRTCRPADTPYCISRALVASVTGQAEEGLVFCGSSASRFDKLTTVPCLIKELVRETEVALD